MFVSPVASKLCDDILNALESKIVLFKDNSGNDIIRSDLIDAIRDAKLFLESTAVVTRRSGRRTVQCKIKAAGASLEKHFIDNLVRDIEATIEEAISQ